MPKRPSVDQGSVYHRHSCPHHTCHASGFENVVVASSCLSGTTTSMPSIEELRAEQEKAIHMAWEVARQITQEEARIAAAQKITEEREKVQRIADAAADQRQKMAEEAVAQREAGLRSRTAGKAGNSGQASETVSPHHACLVAALSPSRSFWNLMSVSNAQPCPCSASGVGGPRPVPTVLSRKCTVRSQGIRHARREGNG